MARQPSILAMARRIQRLRRNQEALRSRQTRQAQETAPWGIAHLRPLGDGVDKEPFPDWWARVRHELPHLPECVAEQWIHRHWGLSPYSDLPIRSMKFDKQHWPNERILPVDATLRTRGREHWSEQLGVPGSAHASLWLGKYMLTHGTWPVPIIILHNVLELQGFRRFHMIEGHMRSAFFHHLVKTGQALPEHDVWIATLDSD